MKHIAFSVLSIWLVGCSQYDYQIPGPTIPERSTRRIHYLHLISGDSMGFGRSGPSGFPWQDPGIVDFYSRVEGTTILRRQTYHRVEAYPIGAGYPPTLLMREDNEGNISAIFSSDTANSPGMNETFLYKTTADVGEKWSFYYYGDTISCTLLSRGDTAKTFVHLFSDCLRIRIQFNWFTYEDQWLAPGVGIVKRDFQTLSLPPLYLPQIDLKDLRLKSLSRR